MRAKIFWFSSEIYTLWCLVLIPAKFIGSVSVKLSLCLDKGLASLGISSTNGSSMAPIILFRELKLASSFSLEVKNSLRCGFRRTVTFGGIVDRDFFDFFAFIIKYIS